MNKQNDTRLWIMFGIILLAALLLLSVLKSQLNGPVKPAQERPALVPAAPREPITVDSMHLMEINDALAYIDGYDPKEHEGYLASHYASTAKILNEYGLLAVRFEDDPNEKVAAAAKSLKKKLKPFRVKYMPLLRKRWAEAADKALWENDIDVRAFGAGNRILEFVGGTFALNANIKESHTSIREDLGLLRFNQVNYKWYSGDDEYTYFTLKVPPDTEL